MNLRTPTLLITCVLTLAGPASAATVVASDEEYYASGLSAPALDLHYGLCVGGGSLGDPYAGCTYLSWGPVEGEGLLVLEAKDATGLPVFFEWVLRGPSCPDEDVLRGATGRGSMPLPEGCTAAYVWMGAGATVGTMTANVWQS